MTAADWEAWCDARRPGKDEPPPGLGWDDEEDEDPGLAPGEQVASSAGFAKGGMADGLPGGSDWRSWPSGRPGTATGTRGRRMVSWTG